MLDSRLRPLVERTLSRAGRALARHGIGANAVTLAGFLIGLAGAVALAVQAYWIGLALILANRLCDGLDGVVAREVGATDFGGFLDIVCDFIFYAAVIFGFIVGQPEHALAGAFLILSFVGTGASFLAFAVVAAKRGMSTSARGRKAFYYVGGLTEGTETITLFVLICLIPDWFPWLADGFGALCWVTTCVRSLEAYTSFHPPRLNDRDDR